MKRSISAWLYLALAVAVGALAGCGSASDSSSPTDMNDLAKMLDKPAQEASKPAEPTPPAQPKTQPVATKVDVEKTHQLKPDGSYMGAIMAANRSIRNKLDDIAWKQTVQNYKATTGHLPKDTKEFMTAIQAIGTPLPEIEEGHEFEYDPSEGQFGTLYEVSPPP